MKKTLFLLLVAFVCLALVACGSDKKEETPAATEGTPAATEGTPAATEETPVVTEKNKVEEFVEENGDDMVAMFEAGFESSGLTCSSTVKTEGNGFVITVCVNEITEATEEMKTQLQATYDEGISEFDQALAEFQKEVPELEYFKIELCTKDGDLLATINVGK